MSGDGTEHLTGASEKSFTSALTRAEHGLEKGDMGAVIADCSRAFEKWPDVRFLRQILLKASETANAQERKTICDLLLRTEMRDEAQDADIAAAWSTMVDLRRRSLCSAMWCMVSVGSVFPPGTISVVSKQQDGMTN